MQAEFWNFRVIDRTVIAHHALGFVPPADDWPVFIH
jgi:hypothetical protein